MASQRHVTVGGVQIGGGAPVAVQTMTKTETANLAATMEQIKKFHVVEGDWTPGGDELTPTMKLKRKPIEHKYADAIEAMYAD